METDGGAGHPLGMNYATKPEAKGFFDPVAKILQSSGAGIFNFSEHAGGADVGPLTKLGVPGFSPIGVGIITAEFLAGVETLRGGNANSSLRSR